MTAENENVLLKAKHAALLAALETVFAGQPLSPAFAWPATIGKIRHQPLRNVGSRTPSKAGYFVLVSTYDDDQQ